MRRSSPADDPLTWFCLEHGDLTGNALDNAYRCRQCGRHTVPNFPEAYPRLAAARRALRQADAAWARLCHRIKKALRPRRLPRTRR